jgi:hypothetical protein
LTLISLAVWRAFRERGVIIPLPRRDLHVKQTNSSIVYGHKRSRSMAFGMATVDIGEGET